MWTELTRTLGDALLEVQEDLDQLGGDGGPKRGQMMRRHAEQEDAVTKENRRVEIGNLKSTDR